MQIWLYYKLKLHVFSGLYPASSRRFDTSLEETFVCKSRKRLTASFTLFGGCGSLKVVKALLKILFFSLLVFAVFWPSVSRVCWPPVSRISWVARRRFREILSRLIEVWTHPVSIYNSCVAASIRVWISCALWHAARCLGHHRRRWCTSRADLSSLLNVENTF